MLRQTVWPPAVNRLSSLVGGSTPPAPTKSNVGGRADDQLSPCMVVDVASSIARMWMETLEAASKGALACHRVASVAMQLRAFALGETGAVLDSQCA